MLQAARLLRHGAKHNPPGSSEESCFCTPLDHIVHEAGIYLSSSAGLRSECHSEEISKQKGKDLLEKKSHQLVWLECPSGCR